MSTLQKTKLQLSPDFHIREFKCNSGEEVPLKYIPNVTKLAGELQKLRDFLGEPIHINSAYRTPAHNKKVGGKPKSMHLTASAADITVKSKSPAQLAAIIERLITKGVLRFGGIGIYRGFIHLDVGPVRRWKG